MKEECTNTGIHYSLRSINAFIAEKKCQMPVKLTNKFEIGQRCILKQPREAATEAEISSIEAKVYLNEDNEQVSEFKYTVYSAIGWMQYEIKEQFLYETLEDYLEVVKEEAKESMYKFKEDETKSEN